MPPSYNQVAGSHWPGEGLSTTTAGSDTELKSHNPLKVIGNGDPPRSILYDRNSPRGSPKVPELPPKPEVRFDLSHHSPRSGSGSPRGQPGSPSRSPSQSSPDPVKPADVDLNVYDSLPHHSLLSGKDVFQPDTYCLELLGRVLHVNCVGDFFFLISRCCCTLFMCYTLQ